MTEKSETTASSPAQATPKKQAAKTQKPRVKPNHPPTSNMVLAAIKSLNERGGSSLQAIKKYIAATFKVDVEKQAPFIKKYLKNAVDSGALVRTKGKGASGSFKVNASKGENKPKKAKSAAKPKTAAAKKPATAKKPKVAKKPAEKKTASEVKKPAAAKKTAAAKQDKKRVAAKKPAAKKPVAAKPVAKKSIAKKTAKAPAAKTKTPKPKKAAAKATPKKK